MKVQNNATWQKSNDDRSRDAAKPKGQHSVPDSFVKSGAGVQAPTSSKTAQAPQASLSLDVNGKDSRLSLLGLKLLSANMLAAPGAAEGLAANTTPALPPDELRTPSVNPAPVEDSSWQPTQDMTLFPNGTPSASDVQQHGFGDCYVISTLSSLASSNPDFIQQAITKDPNVPNAYNVRMYDPSGAPITVSVDDSVAVNAEGKMVSTTGGDGQPNWASIAEKAYAKYTEAYPEAHRKEDYNALSDGGAPAAPMRAFTGQDATRLPTSSVGGSTDDATTATQLQQSIASGQPVVADTGYEDGDWMTLASGERIVGAHAYTVSQVYQDSSGGYRVQVRNPWGTTPETNGRKKTNDDSGDGVIDMSISEYQAVFNGTTIGGGDTASSNVDMNTRNNAYGAEQIAQHKDPDNMAVYNNAGGQYTVVAGKDAKGAAQIQVFDGKGDKDEEFNYKGGAPMEPNTSYLVVDHYVNVDANGKPTISTTATSDNIKSWNAWDNTWEQSKRSSLSGLNGGNGPH